MASYVTRGELHEELDALEQRLELLIEQKLEPHAKKTDLDAMCTVLVQRMDLIEQRSEQRSELREQRLLVELARHVNAANEETRAFIRSLDDKYASLPARVDRLETAVFPPKRQRRR
jgi:hypothetical protein